MPGPQDSTATTATSQRSAVHHDGRTDHSRSWEELALADDEVAWRARTRVVLTPMAAPSIMGLFGFTLATLMVGAWQAGWYGGPATPGVIWPFALFAGGLFQVVAAIACLRARDGIAVAVHTTWGAFWVAWGVLEALASSGVIAPIHLGAASPSFAFWFIGLTIVTVSAMLASLARNLVLSLTLGILAAGAALTAAGFYGGSLGTVHVGGWFFVGSATAAWILASAMMLEHAFGRTVIPLGAYRKEANVPGRRATIPIEWESGMPGVRAGQ